MVVVVKQSKDGKTVRARFLGPDYVKMKLTAPLADDKPFKDAADDLAAAAHRVSHKDFLKAQCFALPSGGYAYAS